MYKRTYRKKRPRKLTKITFTLVILILGFILAQFSSYNLAFITPNKQILQGIVQKIYDGDTMTIRSQNQIHRIRLYGLDAPELRQSFGVEARDFLAQLCPIGSQIEIRVKDNDKYKRLVGVVVCEEVDVNAMLVKNGYAWAYQDYTPAYIPLEMYARFHKLGLWAQDNPQRPSLYRANKTR